jgi:hypothetical protein
MLGMVEHGHEALELVGRYFVGIGHDDSSRIYVSKHNLTSECSAGFRTREDGRMDP